MTSRVRTSAVIEQAGKILTFFAVDPYDGREFYFLPGGKVERHETAPEAAERETLEETGFKVRIDSSFSVDKEYFFHWNNVDYNVLTIFYRGFLSPSIQSPLPVADAEYNKGVKWIDIQDIDKVFAYSKDIADAVKEILAHRLL